MDKLKNIGQFYKYQNKAKHHIMCNYGAGLFMGMSLGKTAITLGAMNDILDDFDCVKPIIIAPLRVAETVWDREALEWEEFKHLTFSIITGTVKQRLEALNKKADIYVINRENIVWLGEHYKSKFPFDMIIIDESSSFKNASSKRFRMLKKILNLPIVKRSVILTGTPGNYMDLWSQTFILDRGKRLGKNITMFKRSYFEADYMGFNFTIKDGAKENIDNKIKDIIISMETDDYLDLPPYINEIVQIPIDKKLTKQYTDFENNMIYELEEMKKDGDIITALTAATLTNKLLQFCSGAMYDEDKNVHIIHDLKYKALDDILEDNPTEQILVAYNFKHEKQRLLERYPFAVEMDKKGEAVNKWNDGSIRMLVGHAASMGHGLNLHKSNAHTIVWFSGNFSLELYDQFNARLRRNGQKYPVSLIHLTIGAVEYRLMKSLVEKRAVEKSIMDALKG